jgi:hypothetical protein
MVLCMGQPGYKEVRSFNAAEHSRTDTRRIAMVSTIHRIF